MGRTGLNPEERFANLKQGFNASRVVQLHGVRLVLELYEFYIPMPIEPAVVMEQEFAEDLRGQDYALAGGH